MVKFMILLVKNELKTGFLSSMVTIFSSIETKVEMKWSVELIILVLKKEDRMCYFMFQKGFKL